MKTEDYLYHYTNLRTLELILKNKTIRFKSLNNMDDIQEEETADLKNIGQFVYISSWTDDEKESIPMWDRYASLDSGIRIRLRRNPFKVYDNYASDLSSVFNGKIIDESEGKSFKTIIPLVEMFTKGFIIQPMFEDILYKVEYTDDRKKLYPYILEENEDFSIMLGRLGKYKNSYWAFQNEWRYIFTALPLNLNQSSLDIYNDFRISAYKMKKEMERQPFPYYDMVIEDDAFSKMEITMGPCINRENRKYIQDLIKKYNASAQLKESNLCGLIR